MAELGHTAALDNLSALQLQYIARGRTRVVMHSRKLCVVGTSVLHPTGQKCVQTRVIAFEQQRLGDAPDVH